MEEKKKIQVVVRVRPLSKKEAAVGGAVDGNGTVTDGNCSVGSWILNSTGVQQQHRSYTFDRVFSPHEQTESVYAHLVKPILDGAVDGINGTIFAYGQTSSGKTHTMEGRKEDPGVIPLCVKDLFAHIAERPEREFLIRASYVEIYNEVVRDLLNPAATNLKVHEHHQKGVYVGGLSEEVVTSASQLTRLMERGAMVRRVGATNLNERSSRSHTIFRIMVESRVRGAGGLDDSNESIEEDTAGAVIASSLSLVDLAGSERAKSTGASGERLREGSAINKSLLALSSVIKKLSDGGAGHVPFRDSKLTRILQPALGGNSNTGVICAMTPAPQHTEESHSTLQFASRAKNIANKPVVNEILDDQAMLKRMKMEMSALKRQLRSLQSGDLPQRIQEMERGQEESLSVMAEQEQRIEKLKKLVLFASRDNTQADDLGFKSGPLDAGEDDDDDGDDDDDQEFAMTMPLKMVKTDRDTESGEERRLSLSFHGQGATIVDELDSASADFAQERMAFLTEQNEKLRVSLENSEEQRGHIADSLAAVRDDMADLEQQFDETSAELERVRASEGRLQQEVTVMAENVQHATAEHQEREESLNQHLRQREASLSAAQAEVRSTKQEVHEAVAAARELGQVAETAAAEHRVAVQTLEQSVEEQKATFAAQAQSLSQRDETLAERVLQLKELESVVSNACSTLHKLDISILGGDATSAPSDELSLEDTLAQHEVLVTAMLEKLVQQTSEIQLQASAIASLQSEAGKRRQQSDADARRMSMAGTDAKVKVAERDLAAKSTQLARLEEKYDQLRTKHRTANDESSKHRAAMVTAQQEATRLRKRVDALEKGDSRKEKAVQQQLEKEMAEPLRKASEAQAHAEEEKREFEKECEALRVEKAELESAAAELAQAKEAGEAEVARVAQELEAATEREAAMQDSLIQAEATSQEVEELREQISSLEEDLFDASAKCQQAESELVDTRAEHADVQQRYEQVREELAKAQREMSALEMEHVEQLETVAKLQGELESGRAELERERADEDVLRGRADNLATQLEEQGERISAAREDVRAAHEKSEEWRERFEAGKLESERELAERETSWSQERSALEAELVRVRSEVSSEASDKAASQLQEEIDAKEMEHEAAMTRLRESLEADLERVRDQVEELRDEVANFKTEKRRYIRENKKALKNADDKMQAIVQDLTVVKAERDDLTAEVTKLNQLKQTLGAQAKDKIAKLEAEVRSLHEKENEVSN
jgi:centromeric protein E